MKLIVRIFFILAIAANLAAAPPEDLNAALLDARVKMVSLRLRYDDRHPKIIEEQTKLDILSRKAPPVSPRAYAALLQSRIDACEIQKSALALRYAEKHPKMISVNAQLAFLREELKRTQAKF